MQELRFKDFLINQDLTEKGVKSRISKARRIEKELGADLEMLVSSSDKMYDAFRWIEKFDDKHNNYQNGLRKYYEFKNGKVFPKRNDYRGQR